MEKEEGIDKKLLDLAEELKTLADENDKGTLSDAEKEEYKTKVKEAEKLQTEAQNKIKNKTR